MANTFYYQRGESAGTIADLSSVFGFSDQSVIFENGTNLSQDNTHFTWDYTNFLLKILGKYRTYESAYANAKYGEIYKNSTNHFVVYNCNDSTTAIGHIFVKNSDGSSDYLFSTEDDGNFMGRVTHQSVTSVSANYSAGNQYEVIFCDASGGAFTVTLPAISTAYTGKHYHIIKTDSSGNAVTIARSSTDTFVGTGTTSLSLATQGAKANLISNGNGKWGVF